ncbi:MAG: hypothetical protein WDN69_35865 [Aliidongia sp.]
MTVLSENRREWKALIWHGEPEPDDGLFKVVVRFDKPGSVAAYKLFTQSQNVAVDEKMDKARDFNGPTILSAGP